MAMARILSFPKPHRADDAATTANRQDAGPVTVTITLDKAVLDEVATAALWASKTPATFIADMVRSVFPPGSSAA
jgi:hypothetical protein